MKYKNAKYQKLSDFLFYKHGASLFEEDLETIFNIVNQSENDTKKILNNVTEDKNCCIHSNHDRYILSDDEQGDRVIKCLICGNTKKLLPYI